MEDHRPSLTEIQALIQIIGEVNLNQIDVRDLTNMLTPLFEGYVVKSPTLPLELELYRGVIYKQKPTQLSQLSYPPPQFAAQGRANQEGVSFFYCGNTRGVPIHELPLCKDDTLVLSRWKFARVPMIQSVGYTKANFKRLKAQRKVPWWKIGKKDSIDMTNPVNLLVNGYLSQAFSQQVPSHRRELYKLTNAITEKHYSESEEKGVVFDGLIYPTTKLQANADNLALTQKFVDSGGIRFVEAEWMKFKSVNGNKVHVDVLDWANSIARNNIIDWKGRLQKHAYNLDTGIIFQEVNGRRVATDVFGETIEPH